MTRLLLENLGSLLGHWEDQINWEHEPRKPVCRRWAAGRKSIWVGAVLCQCWPQSITLVTVFNRPASSCPTNPSFFFYLFWTIKKFSSFFKLWLHPISGFFFFFWSVNGATVHVCIWSGSVYLLMNDHPYYVISYPCRLCATFLCVGQIYRGFTVLHSGHGNTSLKPCHPVLESHSLSYSLCC